MSRPGGSFDQSKSIALYARVGEIGVPLVLIFKKKTDGTPYPIDELDFELLIYRNSTDDDPVITLIIGDGLTVLGADANKLQVELSKSRSQQRAESHFWLLKEITSDHSWFNGPFIFHRGEFDGIAAEQVSNDMDITVTVDVASGVATGFKGSWDASGDTFPDTADLNAGDWYILSVGGNLPNPTNPEFIPERSLIFYLGSDAWRIVT